MFGPAARRRWTNDVPPGRAAPSAGQRRREVLVDLHDVGDARGVLRPPLAAGGRQSVGGPSVEHGQRTGPGRPDREARRPHVLVGRADGEIGLRGLAEVDRRPAPSRSGRRPRPRRRGSSRSECWLPVAENPAGVPYNIATAPASTRRPASLSGIPTARSPGAPRPKSFALSTAPRWSPVFAVSASGTSSATTAGARGRRRGVRGVHPER